MNTGQSIKLPLTLQRKAFESTFSMSKSNYVEQIVQDNRPLRLPKEAIKEIVEATFEFMMESLQTHEKFTYPGFGSFRVKSKKSRTGVHPATGQSCMIAGRRMISFKVSGKLKKTLR